MDKVYAFSTGPGRGGYRKPVSARWSSSAVCEEPVAASEGVSSDLVRRSGEVGANVTVLVAAAISGVWSVENDGGEDVDCSVPDNNDKVGETVADRCDLESTPSTFSASSCEASASEPCIPLPVSCPC